jgi:hypothetical protein
LKLRTLAEIATIIGVIVTILAFVKIEPNAIDKLPEIYKEKADSDVRSAELLIKKDDYQGKSEALYRQYRAAMAITSTYSQDDAIRKFVDSALAVNDYKIAIAAAKQMNSSYSKSDVLSEIAEQALVSKNNAGYAVVAAELIPSSYTKDSLLAKIVQFYETGTFESDDKNSKELTTLQKYKAIYTFADSSNQMGMSEKDAKLFTDKWMKERDYESFLFLKELYIFADSSNQMGMSAKEARKFAFDWIDNSYTKDDFKIFKEAYIFADSSNSMGMSGEQATAFAYQKMKEAKSANKQIQPTAEGGG